jgi:hypothetical protein
MLRSTHPLLVALLLAVCAPAAAFAQDEPVSDTQLEQEEAGACAADSEAEECEEQEAAEEDVPTDGVAPGAGGETSTRRVHDRTVPKVTRLRVRSVRGGKRVTYRLSEKADITLVFEKCTVRRASKCIHWSRTSKRIYKHGRKGANSALIGARTLPKGQYVVEIHAVDGGHHHSNIPHTLFRI